jgi:hypothetical protein
MMMNSPRSSMQCGDDDGEDVKRPVFVKAERPVEETAQDRVRPAPCGPGGHCEEYDTAVGDPGTLLVATVCQPELQSVRSVRVVLSAAVTVPR